MIELTNQFGALDFSNVTPDDIATLSPEAQAALVTLIDCNGARVTADARKVAAVKRNAMASAAEIEAAQAYADSNMPIPFHRVETWTAAELAAARAAHDLKCRQLLEHRARQRASGVSDADGVATLDKNGHWPSVVPPVKTGHAKTKGPSSFKIALEKCEAECTAAQSELHAATDLARRASVLEADAFGKFQAPQRRPTQDEVLRENAQRSLEQRAANIAAGLNPNQQFGKDGKPAQPVKHRNPIDVLAASRSRNAGPLRSATVRRNV